jgi:hypothetical protein
VIENPVDVVEGASKLVSLFGEWPGFREAAILYLRIDRTGPTVTAGFRLHEWTESHPGQYLNATVRWLEVQALALSGISEENRIAALTLAPEGENLRTVLESLDGLHGYIDARRMRVLDVAIVEE